jgi:hypothetical protein
VQLLRLLNVLLVLSDLKSGLNSAWLEKVTLMASRERAEVAGALLASN